MVEQRSTESGDGPCTPDRAENVVNVYRILAKGTIEEKIVELQERKLQLSDRILGGESLQAQGLTREELLELLR